MTQFRHGSSIKREIKVFGVDQPVLIEIDASGITFWVKGSRKKTTLSWYQAVQASHTPSDVPSFLMGKPLELLQYQAARK